MNSNTTQPPAAGEAAPFALPLTTRDTHYVGGTHMVTLVDRVGRIIGTMPKDAAAFIVRACNSRAALVGAAESAAAELDAIPFIHRHDGINKPLATLRAALAHAKAV